MEEDTALGCKQNDHGPMNRNNDPNQPKYVLRHHIAPKVKELVRKGLSLDEIVAELGEDSIPARDRTILSLAEQGLKLKCIASQVELEGETVRRVVGSYGFKQRREEVKRKGIQQESEVFRKRRAGFVTVLMNKGTQGWEELIARHGNAALKAFEYFSTKTWTTQDNPERVITLLTRYYEAKDEGEQKSLGELGDDLGFFPSGVRRILECVGLDPLYERRNFVSRAEGKARREVILRALDDNMGISDISYFVDYNQVVLRSSCRQKRLPTPSSPLGISVPTRSGTGLTLLHHAAEVYEAQDAGFETEEIIQYLNPRGGYTLSKRGIVYLLEQRNAIEPEIILVLQHVYDDKTVSCAYQKWKYKSNVAE